MKIQIFSDLHVDVRPPKPIEVAADVEAVVVAGDVCEAAEHGFAWLRGIVPTQLFLLTLAEDRAETARPPARFRVPRRSQSGGLR